MKRIPVLLALLIIIMACQSDEPARPAENNDTTEDPSDQNDPGDQNQEPPAFELNQNTISLASTGMTNEDIVRTFYDVSGTFIYEVGGEIYGFYPGVADWSLGSSIEEISPVESIILKKDGDQHKTVNILSVDGKKIFVFSFKLFKSDLSISTLYLYANSGF
ncbi:MAG: hypothetical protein ACPF82_07525, partial [Flavobacteriaceae bacterium]